MEDYIHKCNRRSLGEQKKLYKIINIAVAENTENVYHNTRQNLNFAHTPQNKKTKIKTSS